MSLLKREKERARKAAEEAARQAEEKKLQDLAIHPLVKDGCGRDVCDAYFHGLVFAVFADDDKMDKGERSILNDIGGALGLPSQEVEEIITHVQTLADAGKLSLLDECVNAIKGNETAVKLFYVQFTLIWTSHEHDEEELSDYLQKFAEWTEIEMPKAVQEMIKATLAGGEDADEELYDLSEWMGEAALKYFAVKQYGDVTEKLAGVRKRKQEAEEKRQRAKAEKAAREKAQQQLDGVMKDVVRAYGDKASVSVEVLEDISERVKEIDNDMIDWPATVNALLKRSVTSRFTYSSLFFGDRSCTRVDLYKCRRKVWQLVTLLMLDYEPEWSSMCSDLDWLLSSKGIAADCWKERLESFISEYLRDRVSLE